MTKKNRNAVHWHAAQKKLNREGVAETMGVPIVELSKYKQADKPLPPAANDVF